MLIIAHRGASAYKPENTISAFKEAIKMKADGIELDIRLTKDKKLAVIHDKTIDRTTSGKGKVKNYTLKQLKKYKIPGLQEVIDIIKQKNILLFIEIKDKGAEEDIIKIIKKNKLTKKIIIVSFYKESIKKIKKLSKIQTGFIFSKNNNARKIALSLKADWILPNYDLINKNFVQKAHKSKLRILAWTVNEINLAEKLYSLSIDGIATNNPNILKN